jgi:uncharacterized integral membrane protein
MGPIELSDEVKTPMMNSEPQAPRRRYRWPWFLLVAAIVALLLTIIWVLGAVRRVKQIRESTTGHAAIHFPEKVKLMATAVAREVSWNSYLQNQLLSKKRSGPQTPRRWG